MFLANGHPVTALDRDTAGIADLTGRRGFDAVAADLEDGSPWPMPARSFAAVIVTNYLHRPLFPAPAVSVARGGLLIYVTFAVGHQMFGRPSDAALLLRSGAPSGRGRWRE